MYEANWKKIDSKIFQLNTLVKSMEGLKIPLSTNEKRNGGYNTKIEKIHNTPISELIESLISRIGNDEEYFHKLIEDGKEFLKDSGWIYDFSVNIQQLDEIRDKGLESFRNDFAELAAIDHSLDKHTLLSRKAFFQESKFREKYDIKNPDRVKDTFRLEVWQAKAEIFNPSYTEALEEVKNSLSDESVKPVPPDRIVEIKENLQMTQERNKIARKEVELGKMRQREADFQMMKFSDEFDKQLGEKSLKDLSLIEGLEFREKRSQALKKHREEIGREIWNLSYDELEARHSERREALKPETSESKLTINLKSLKQDIQEGLQQIKNALGFGASNEREV